MNWQPVKIIDPALTVPIAPPQAHLFSSELGDHLFVVDGSQVYDIDADLRDVLTDKIAAGDNLRDFLDLPTPPPRRPFLTPPKIRSLSLAVSQACNLGCTYCYAEGGSFGGATTKMSRLVAEQTVQNMFADLQPGERANLAFMGGEPLANRAVIRSATELGATLAEQQGVRLGFSITTNGTLLTQDDIDFFCKHGFAVTISLDGVGDTHDKLRPFKNGRGSFERIIERCRPLIAAAAAGNTRCQVTARVTVTPENLKLLETLDYLVELGFHSVGFAPLLRSPTGQLELQRSELSDFLQEMIACSDRFENRLASGQQYPFSNVMSALREIHRGTEKSYSCGAGVGYAGVSASGDLYACHRFVGDDRGKLGDLRDGLDGGKRTAWLQQRHVDQQQPCGSCWARHLCGGGCHHEVIERERSSCDFIRGWLEHCLKLYLRLQTKHPQVFTELLG